MAEPAGTDAADAPSYDYLFGATISPRIADPAPDTMIEDAPGALDPAPAGGAAAEQAGATAGWHTMLPSDSVVSAREQTDGAAVDSSDSKPSPVVRAGAASAPAAAVDGLIDAVPWLAGASAAAAPKRPDQSGPAPASVAFASASASSVAQPPSRPQPAPIAAQPAVEDAEGTVNRAALLAGLAQGAAGLTVLANRCPAGHLTPPHTAACRVCRASVAEQPPFEITRPALGVLRLSTGDTVTLDRGVLIGRKPAAPPGVAGRPHLVRVNSPEHDVSRQHAELVLEGWQVYVRDLGSTNGTTVTLPGQSPQRLREGEPQLLEHGAVIVLADEIQCVFEVTS